MRHMQIVVIILIKWNDYFTATKFTANLNLLLLIVTRTGPLVSNLAGELPNPAINT